MPHKLLHPYSETSLRLYPGKDSDGLIPAHPDLANFLLRAGLNPENPFSPWIQPGMKVLIKPNWVRHAAENWAIQEALTTHTSLIRPTVEWACRALQLPNGGFAGEVLLADAPLQSADFDLLLHQAGIHALATHWRTLGLPVRIADLRRIAALTDEATGVVQQTKQLPGDPAGDTVVDLQSHSRLEEIATGKMGVSNYDFSFTSQHHAPGKHEYRIANSLLQSDVVINLPKWKTHVKTGVTGALKNFIGINCDKAYLPHFRVGPPAKGGDEHPDSWLGESLTQLRPLLEARLPAFVLRTLREKLLRWQNNGAKSLVFGGAWPGNDTLWRTVHDMVFIARWLGSDGAKRSSPRPILTLLDAIVAGEGDGPLRPQPKQMNSLIFGLDPGLVDVTAAALSGFSWQSIPVLAHLLDQESPLATHALRDLLLPSPCVALQPPTAWREALTVPHRDNQNSEALAYEAA
ncbi:MAG: DUF362 domain-containing protein [Bryobacter sp.]|nr:DUF362 domain-containing protein [Bryobacter sp.]